MQYKIKKIYKEILGLFGEKNVMQRINNGDTGIFLESLPVIGIKREGGQEIIFPLI